MGLQCDSNALLAGSLDIGIHTLDKGLESSLQAIEGIGAQPSLRGFGQVLDLDLQEGDDLHLLLNVREEGGGSRAFRELFADAIGELGGTVLESSDVLQTHCCSSVSGSDFATSLGSGPGSVASSGLGSGPDAVTGPGLGSTPGGWALGAP